MRIRIRICSIQYLPAVPTLVMRIRIRTYSIQYLPAVPTSSGSSSKKSLYESVPVVRIRNMVPVLQKSTFRIKLPVVPKYDLYDPNLTAGFVRLVHVAPLDQQTQ
jgi:hypothetical protein